MHSIVISCKVTEDFLAHVLRHEGYNYAFTIYQIHTRHIKFEIKVLRSRIEGDMLIKIGRIRDNLIILSR